MLLALLTLFSLAYASMASADSTSTVTGTFSNGATFNPGSTLSINTTTGNSTGSNLMLSTGEAVSGPPTIINAPTEYGWFVTLDENLALYANFVGFTGGPVTAKLF